VKRWRAAAGVLLFWFCAVPTPAQQQVLEVIELRYRSAADVIPVLQPLLAPGATITGMQNKLVVRTTPENLAELRTVLETVDGLPKRLVISVRQEESALRSGTDLEVQGRIGTGPDEVRGRAQSTRSDHAGRATQTVQVLEGNAAFIRLGASVPVRSRQSTIGPGGVVRETETLQYRDVDTGFYAQPRVHADRVTIQLATRRDAVADDRHGIVRIQRVESVVSGRLGEWIEVGGVLQDEDRKESGAVYYRSRTDAERRRIFVKVDRLP
jgi:type II secretory pathway component GspD/PulD (secretin)